LSRRSEVSSRGGRCALEPEPQTGTPGLDFTQRVELVALAVRERAARCRVRGAGTIITLRAHRIWHIFPGEIVVVRPHKELRVDPRRNWGDLAARSALEAEECGHRRKVHLMLTALAFVRATGLHADERHADALSLRIRPTHSRTDWLKKNQSAPQRLRCDLTIGWGSIAIR